MEIIKSIRYFKICIRGLNKFSPQNYWWAIRQTQIYRKNRKSIIKEYKLGYLAQFRNIWKKQSQIEKEEKHIQQIKEPQNIRINRINYYDEVKREQEFERRKKRQTMLFKAKMKILSIYYGMSVQNMGAKVGNFLKLYHESLQSLVQGYREVTMDSKGEFRFQKDGKSVKERCDDFERKLEEYSSGVSKQIKEKKFM